MKNIQVFFKNGEEVHEMKKLKILHTLVFETIPALRSLLINYWPEGKGVSIKLKYLG